VRSRSDASDSARHFNKLPPPTRLSSDCTDDTDSQVSDDRLPLRDDVYARRDDERRLYDYKVGLGLIVFLLSSQY